MIDQTTPTPAPQAVSTSADKTIAIINGALTVLEIFGPQLGSLFSSGQITTQQQADLAARMTAIRTGTAFSGPEWQVQ